MPKRVLIVVDDPELAAMLEGNCRRLGVEVENLAPESLPGGSPFSHWRVDRAPDLIVLDGSLLEQAGSAICEADAGRNALALVPLILLAEGGESAIIRRCQDLDAYIVAKTAEARPALMPLICGLLGIDVPADDADRRFAVADLPAHQGDESPGAVSGDGSRRWPRVLCIDDDEHFTDVIARRLSAAGIDVVTACNGLEGFWKALKERPHLVITDHAMPEGYASYLLRRLKDHPLTREIPVVVVTGRDLAGRPANSKDCALERQLQNLGAECVLTKPIDHEALLAELERHIPLARREETSPELQPC